MKLKQLKGCYLISMAKFRFAERRHLQNSFDPKKDFEGPSVQLYKNQSYMSTL